MLVALERLDERRLLGMLAEQFGVTGARIRFVPVGEDSWCYRVGDLWVSVRRDLRGHLPAAYAAARALRASGLEFVLAPLAGADSRVVHRVDGFPVVVFSYLDVAPLDTEPLSPADAATAVRMLERLHDADACVGAGLPAETFDLPFSDDLDATMRYADGEPGDSGPYSRRLHALLRSHRERLDELRGERDVLADACAADPGTFVLTHGEPLHSNFMRTRDGLLLADWGELMWGPPERDWNHVIRTFGVAVACRPNLLRYYELRWFLSEVAEYATTLIGRHADSADARRMWDSLVRYLSPGNDDPMASLAPTRPGGS